MEEHLKQKGYRRVYKLLQIGFGSIHSGPVDMKVASISFRRARHENGIGSTLMVNHGTMSTRAPLSQIFTRQEKIAAQNENNVGQLERETRL